MLSHNRLSAFARFVRRLLVGFLFCYVAVALSLGGAPAARPVFHGLAVLWILVLCVGSGLRARRHTPPNRGIRTLEIVFANVALTVVLAEVALQAFAACTGRSLLFGNTLDDHRLVPGRDYGDGLRGNSRGYPGPDIAPVKPPGVYRIAALGDSFAVGPAVPFAENYLTLLQTALPGVEVCNFGVSGAGPHEYLAVLQRDVWGIQPDLVLVSIFVGNDITETLPTPRGLDPRRHALYVLGERAWRLLREGQRRPSVPPAAAPQRLGAPALSVETFREIEARRLAVCLTQAPPGLEKKWQQALGYLNEIVRACSARRVKVAFVLIPDEFQVNGDVLADAVGDAQVSRSDIDLERPQRRLRAFCAERGVPCLDLLDTLRGVPDTYAPHDTHWNVRGNRLAAARLAEWLRGQVAR
ncbi:MAG TPA: GDSL-type esterase/lipase family protein [Gemmataceae bacterium]|nr:GDSL-type esterase/lipase family protein [Gemmataceae bacterium]